MLVGGVNGTGKLIVVRLERGVPPGLWSIYRGSLTVQDLAETMYFRVHLVAPLELFLARQAFLSPYGFNGGYPA